MAQAVTYANSVAPKHQLVLLHPETLQWSRWKQEPNLQREDFLLHGRLITDQVRHLHRIVSRNACVVENQSNNVGLVTYGQILIQQKIELMCKYCALRAKPLGFHFLCRIWSRPRKRISIGYPFCTCMMPARNITDRNTCTWEHNRYCNYSTFKKQIFQVYIEKMTGFTAINACCRLWWSAGRPRWKFHKPWLPKELLW